MGMQIEVVTTKKKLTKSIIRQMFTASEHSMNVGIVLGYVTDVIKPSKLAIIRHCEDYYTMELLQWKPDLDTSAGASYGRSTKIKRFKTKEKRDLWLASYNSMKAKALKTHIYI